ncbi:hypothetical protein M8J75_001702 [Diaphorina citri]|nr:hypothetical protein M8J75_001702 [Diaphorina citri]
MSHGTMVRVNSNAAILFVIFTLTCQLHYGVAQPAGIKEASSQTIRDDSERTILNRRQSIASMLGSAAAIPMFALQSGWNNLQRNFDYMKYGLYNGLQNFGQALNNGYYGAQQALYNSVYNAPYNTFNPYAYNMPGYGGYPQMSGYGGYPQMPGYGGYPQMPGWWGRLN